MHIHCPVAAGSGFDRSRMYTIQIHPSWKLHVDWIPSGLAEQGSVPWVRGRGLSSTWIHKGQAGQSSKVHRLLFFCIAYWTQLHIWQFCQDSLHPTFSCRAHNIIAGISWMDPCYTMHNSCHNNCITGPSKSLEQPQVLSSTLHILPSLLLKRFPNVCDHPPFAQWFSHFILSVTGGPF